MNTIINKIIISLILVGGLNLTAFGYDAVTNNTGVVIERYKYTAYGASIFLDATGNPIPQSVIRNSHLFTGREYDAETGLYYYRTRYYSASLGRFLQRDPIEHDNLKNLYTYVKNNPTSLLDPFGLYSEQVHRDITVLAGVYVGLDHKDIKKIADANVNTDEKYPPISYPDEHFLSTEESKKELQRIIDWFLRCLIKVDEIDEKFGEALHTYQDSFSHRGLSSTRIGHGTQTFLSWLGIMPDPDAYEPDQTDIAMSSGTMDALEELSLSKCIKQSRLDVKPDTGKKKP